MSGGGATLRQAATVLMLRDTPAGPEVFMVRRNRRIDFASGALVFPGGKVDAADRDRGWPDLCPALEATMADSGADGLAFRLAAIREVFEESGLLLAREAGGDKPIGGGARLDALGTRYRQALNAGEISLRAMAEAERLTPATDLLVPFSHWLTPEAMPRRFDTWFYLAAAPARQLASHDGRESVDSLWIRPLDALQAWRDGDFTVVFPTRLNLQVLGQAATVEQALGAARGRDIPAVMPRIEERADGPWLCIRPDQGYQTLEAPVDGVMRR